MIARPQPMSKTRKPQLRALRTALRTGGDLSKSAELFADLSYHDATFDRDSRQTNSVQVHALVQATLRRLYGKDLDEVYFTAMRLKRTDLVHGSVLTPIGILGFFYLEKCKQGLIVATDPTNPRRTHLVRITALETRVSDGVSLATAAGPPS